VKKLGLLSIYKFSLAVPIPGDQAAYASLEEPPYQGAMILTTCLIFDV
jgi:hypothetical protein